MEKALEILLMDRCDIANHKICTTEMFNEAIAELEEAMKPKTCDGCVYDDGVFCLVACVRRFTHDAYEPKDNA